MHKEMARQEGGCVSQLFAVAALFVCLFVCLFGGSYLAVDKDILPCMCSHHCLISQLLTVILWAELVVKWVALSVAHAEVLTEGGGEGRKLCILCIPTPI